MIETNKTFVITGATSGIGLEITRGLLKAQMKVVMIVRNASLAEKRIIEFKHQFPGCQVQYFIADLSSQAQVEAVADKVLDACPKIHGLINNAGLFMTSHQLSEDEIELTFAVNHMSHFILTHKLLDRMIVSGPARIVMLGSNAHKFVKDIPFDNIGWKNNFRCLKVYGQSKLSNVLFTRQLAKQLPPSVTINAADPGAVATHIGCQNGKLERFVSAICRQFYRPIAKGAEMPLYLALSPEMEGKSGYVFKDNKVVKLSSTAQSDSMAQKLWDFSFQLWKNAPASIHSIALMKKNLPLV